MLSFLRKFFGSRQAAKEGTKKNVPISAPRSEADIMSDFIDMWYEENLQRVKNGQPPIPLCLGEKAQVLECKKAHCSMRIS